MKNIGLVTDVPFWQIGLGKHARIFELVHFLANNSLFTLYFLGEESCPFPSPLLQGPDTPKQLESHLKKAKHDLVIVEYLHLSWVAEIAVNGTQFYLDAIDLLSERTKSFASFNRKFPEMNFEHEIAHFRKFDKVMFLQKEEIEKVLPKLGEEKLLLCPHPVIPEEEIPFQGKVRAISFFGSPSWPNIDGLQWFHDAVLPSLGDLSQKCIVNGTISGSPMSIFSPRIAKGKVFSSLMSYYKTIDIAINPVLYGSGLKIKTTEAIGYGIPLVSTSTGAQGIREEAGKSFLLADTPEEFAGAIRALADSASLRQKISQNARAFAKQFMAPAACFSALLK